VRWAAAVIRLAYLRHPPILVGKPFASDGHHVRHFDSLRPINVGPADSPDAFAIGKHLIQVRHASGQLSPDVSIHVPCSRMAIPAGSACRFIGAVLARRDRCVMFRSKKTFGHSCV
jgi:hypothetical protein